MKSVSRPYISAASAQARRPRSWTVFASVAAAALVAAACSGDRDSAEPAPVEAPAIVVTTSIWADIVSNVACGGLAEVEALIPAGGDPHGYEPSLQDRARMDGAALVVSNGLNLEESLADTLNAVAEAGTPIFEFASEMDPIPYSFPDVHGDDHGDMGHDDHDDHGDEGHDDHHDHGDDGS